MMPLSYGLWWLYQGLLGGGRKGRRLGVGDQYLHIIISNIFKLGKVGLGLLPQIRRCSIVGCRSSTRHVGSLTGCRRQHRP